MEPAPRGEIDLAGATVGLLPIVRRHPEWTPFFIHTEAESFALAAEILEDAQVWVSMLVACAGSEAHLVEEVPRAVFENLPRLYSSDSDLSEVGGTTESWSVEVWIGGGLGRRKSSWSADRNVRTRSPSRRCRGHLSKDTIE